MRTFYGLPTDVLADAPESEAAGDRNSSARGTAGKNAADAGKSTAAKQAGDNLSAAADPKA